jgi:PPM family protein phosphatase
MTALPTLSLARRHQIRLGACYGLTDIGKVRECNEDNFLIDEHLSLVVVADGMGGHASGAQASAEALMSIQKYLANASLQQPADTDDSTIPLALARQRDPLGFSSDFMATALQNKATSIAQQAMIYANHHVFSLNLAARKSDGSGMGTTVTGLWQSDAHPLLTVFHVGDSRLYRYRAGQLVCLTKDQTLYQRAIDEGETRNLPQKNMLWQALGPYEDIQPAIHSLHKQAGDCYLLCTDGLHAVLPHQQIEHILASALPEHIEATCQHLVSMANDAGGRDNVTAIVIHCD